jgi:hypothetical protein
VFVLLGQRQPDDQPTDQPHEYNALISSKDETIAVLKEQLDAERQAHAESRRLLMAALERIPPQLESPEPVQDVQNGAEHQSATEEPQESIPKSWWRRMFGG